MYDITELNEKKVAELKEIADKLNVPKSDKLKKQDLIYQILDLQAMQPSSTAPKGDEDNEKSSAPAKPRKPRQERTPRPAQQDSTN